MEGAIDGLRSEMGEVRREMYTNFRWTIGIVMAVWGSLLAAFIAFR